MKNKWVKRIATAVATLAVAASVFAGVTREVKAADAVVDCCVVEDNREHHADDASIVLDNGTLAQGYILVHVGPFNLNGEDEYEPSVQAGKAHVQVNLTVEEGTGTPTRAEVSFTYDGKTGTGTVTLSDSDYMGFSGATTIDFGSTSADDDDDTDDTDDNTDSGVKEGNSATLEMSDGQKITFNFDPDQLKVYSNNGSVLVFTAKDNMSCAISINAVTYAKFEDLAAIADSQGLEKVNIAGFDGYKKNVGSTPAYYFGIKGFKGLVTMAMVVDGSSLTEENVVSMLIGSAMVSK